MNKTDLAAIWQDQTISISSFPTVLVTLLIAFAVGVFIFWIYKMNFRGVMYSQNYALSLVLLCIITAPVVLCIRQSLALSLGMVGALSIVRFRTAIKDSRDTVYIFWTIIVGICCGVGDYVVAAVGSLAVFLLLLVLGRIKNDDRQLLIIRAARMDEQRIEALLFQYFSRKATLRVKNTTEGSVEFIYELSRRTLEAARNEEKSITDAVYEIGNIEYFNIVAQNDEISS